MTKESLEELISERVGYRKMAKELIRKYRVHSKLGFKSSATKGSYDFDKDKIWLRPNYSYTKDFLYTILHEIYHAMDSKRYGRKKFIKLYSMEGEKAQQKGGDFHDNNPFEIAAERWAKNEARKYFRKYL